MCDAVAEGDKNRLLQIPQQAAKVCANLKKIGDPVAKIGIGSRLVDEAGETMGDIVESVKKVAAIMSDITAATKEQTRGIESIGQAIASIDGMTQQNSALVEEASAAAESLRDQAGQLSLVLSIFKLRDVGRSVSVSEPGGVAEANRPDAGRIE